jgi:Site-specific recombinase XerC
MPRLSRTVPRYRKHRASGQALVVLCGQCFYLGPFGTKASKVEYDRLIAEWLARGRRPLPDPVEESGGITVVELIARYKRYAEVYYRKDGSVTSEVASILSAAKVLKEMYGKEPVNDCGPLRLQAIQQAMIRANWTRKNVNKQVQRIVRMFRWGVSQELVRPDVAQALRDVQGLRKGRTDARESAPVLPVEDSMVNATLEHLPEIVADMVRLQRLTGCRPEEICTIRPCDVDTSGSVWAYRPQSHKTEHHGRERVIFIGPKGQELLRPYLLREKTAFCFCPAEGERKRRVKLHEQRKTPVGYGNGPGTNRKADPQRTAGAHYSTDSYRRAIHRACELAFALPDELRKLPNDLPETEKRDRRIRASQWRAQHAWHPNQLRHSAATEIRKRFGLEASQVVLGHSAADVTQVYAERDMEKAAAVMAQVG